MIPPVFAQKALATAALAASLTAARPCDIYAAGGTPCVAAHSSTRALYGSYNGPLYQVTRGSDNTTADVYPLSAGGVANAATQDNFCHQTTCLITIIYDQSGNNNHLSAAPPGGAATGPEANGYDFVAGATGAGVTLNGQKAYGIFTHRATGYRVDQTTGVATGNDPEGIYAVVDGTHYNGECCFDYGNAETNNMDTGAGNMEALYFGLNGGSQVEGTGSGPWIMVDMENGIFGGNQTVNGSMGHNPNLPTTDYRFTTGMVKGDSSNLWAVRGGNAQSGNLGDFYSGPRPAGYYPMQKQGAIILGIGGDNSDNAQGTFYEGAMTKGYPSDDTENKVQADIVSAGYQTTSQVSGPAIDVGQTISLLSQTNTRETMYLAHNGSSVDIAPVSSQSSTTQKGAATFTVTNPNAPNSGCYSFESVDTPGSYLRHFAYRIYLDTPDNTARSPSTFNEDSTFCPESGFLGSGSSFRSYSYPTRYWRVVDNGDIYIGTNGGPFTFDNANTFNVQASWTVQQGLAP